MTPSDEQPEGTEPEVLPPTGDEPPEPAEPAKRRRGRPRKSEAAGSGDGAAPAADKAPARRRASDVAKRGAGDLYALAGTGAMIGGAHAAGFVMQAQAPVAGRIIAQHALNQWPRFYSFLERTGKASDIAPLFIAPVAAELYVRSDNVGVVTLAHGMLQQMAGDMQVTIPDPNTGEPVQLPMLELLAQARSERVSQAVADFGDAAAAPASSNGAESGAVHPQTGEPLPADLDLGLV